jgi:hypothetical protein
MDLSGYREVLQLFVLTMTARCVLKDLQHHEEIDAGRFESAELLNK